MSLETASLKKSVGEDAVSLAREALTLYAEQGKKHQLGSKAGPLYEKGGAMVRLVSGSTGVLCGTAAVFDENTQLGKSIIDATVTAASERRGQNSVSKKTASEKIISVAIIESVHTVENPQQLDANDSVFVPVFITDDTPGWIHPEVYLENDWSLDEYMERTRVIAKRNNPGEINNRPFFFRVKCYRESTACGLVKHIDSVEDFDVDRIW